MMALSNKQQQALTDMGIQTWRLRTRLEAAPKASDAWETLKETVKNCTLCGLCKSRTQTVFGVGNPHADLMIIGEAPGANEDKRGEPFVGRAGQLLNQILKSIDIERDAIFIANILKCRPPNNRDPSLEEVATCTPYLKQQIALIQPKLIIAVGRIAAQFLLKTQTSLGKMRGQRYEYENIPLYVTYHPAYLLRSPQEKRKALKDWYRIQTALSKN